MIVLEMRFLYQIVIFIDFHLRVEMWERWIILHSGVCCEIWVFLHHTVLLKSFWPFVEKLTTGQPRSKALPHAGSKVREPDRASWVRLESGICILKTSFLDFLVGSRISVSNDFCVLCDQKLYPTIQNVLFFFSLSLSLACPWTSEITHSFSCDKNFPKHCDFGRLLRISGFYTIFVSKKQVLVRSWRWVWSNGDGLHCSKYSWSTATAGNKFLGFGIHMDLVGFLALQTPTNVSSPTSLGRLISSQRSGEVTFPQLFVAREQSLPFLRIPFPGRSSGILSTSFRREAFSKGFFIPFEYRLDRFLCTKVYS